MAVFKKAPMPQAEAVPAQGAEEVTLIVTLLTEHPELTMAAGLVLASMLFFSVAFEWSDGPTP
ncbi:MAG: hypothetical protein AAFR17_12735 [Pseudomonadota bacterium]